MKVGDNYIEIEVKNFDSCPRFPVYGLHYFTSPNLLEEFTFSLVKQGVGLDILQYNSIKLKKK